MQEKYSPSSSYLYEYNHILQKFLLPPEHAGHNPPPKAGSYFFFFSKINLKTTILLHIFST